MIANNIYSANTVYNNLKEYEDEFEIEYKVISELKCMLVNELDIEDYVVDGNLVQVNGGDSDYFLDFKDVRMHVYIKDKMIVDYDYE